MTPRVSSETQFVQGAIIPIAESSPPLPHRKDGYLVKRFCHKICHQINERRKRGTGKMRQIIIRTKSSRPHSNSRHMPSINNNLSSLRSNSMTYVIQSSSGLQTPTELRRAITRKKSITEMKESAQISSLEKWKLKTMALIAAAIHRHNSIKSINDIHSTTSSLRRSKSRSLLRFESTSNPRKKHLPSFGRTINYNHDGNQDNFKRYGIMAQGQQDASLNFLGPIPPSPRWSIIESSPWQMGPRGHLPGYRSIESLGPRLRNNSKFRPRSNFQTVRPPYLRPNSTISPLAPKLSLRIDRTTTDFNELWTTLSGYDTHNMPLNNPVVNVTTAALGQHKTYPTRMRSLMKPAIRKFPNNPKNPTNNNSLRRRGTTRQSPDLDDNSDLASLFELYTMSEEAYGCIKQLGAPPPQFPQPVPTPLWSSSGALWGYSKSDLSPSMGATGYTEPTGSETSAESTRSSRSSVSVGLTESIKSFSYDSESNEHTTTNLTIPMPANNKRHSIPKINKIPTLLTPPPLTNRLSLGLQQQQQQQRLSQIQYSSVQMDNLALRPDSLVRSFSTNPTTPAETKASLPPNLNKDLPLLPPTVVQPLEPGLQTPALDRSSYASLSSSSLSSSLSLISSSSSRYSDRSQPRSTTNQSLSTPQDFTPPPPPRFRYQPKPVLSKNNNNNNNNNLFTLTTWEEWVPHEGVGGDDDSHSAYTEFDKSVVSLESQLYYHSKTRDLTGARLGGSGNHSNNGKPERDSISNTRQQPYVKEGVLYLR